MPERGPVQLLLPLLPSLARAGWKLCIAFLAVAGLLALIREEGLSRSYVAESFSQAAWDLAAHSAVKPAWPWDDGAAPFSTKVTRLGLSAAVLKTETSDAADRSFSHEARASVVVGGPDPHLSAGGLQVGDWITVTTASGRILDYRVTGAKHLKGDSNAVVTGHKKHADPHCAEAEAPAASRLIIEAIDEPKSATPAKSADSKV